ncbi:carbon dioxide-concentrating mechanism protein CcmK [Oculatella sp. FACHB-28]|uniref:carbon dioxide-concentrating mechanism protein CcmK n=1 Tax=Cyanophyceae TaxID=3028117 RepID=UPI00168483DA|nr:MULTISPECIES: carbon dioxide-concentrating mechanism protein CcmK [Cyanophyceae]MBD1868330.1 carbon dioxide-concentrating mechanism protein CcmK [Cyanobacteria bacterium FACHB-471]MBD1998371.1 carbon dioxide-concentrating mechanism protein CcmK [Leptolyngbya sp. FACHB-541]MBD2055701.1 carbon dioxide-concentrating mechanism protein CcmK [Oculatella sp. FACHB-28]MBD2067149.1 carbon dioxide-concentrating mechanism protein CcmK [Leptolyngbya sp. FACHB-671]
MPVAVGSLETKGFPAVLAAADAMVKAGRVTLVGYLRAGSARFTINIRGDVSEVKAAMDAGIVAAEQCYGGTLESWVIIPRPHENVEGVLPIAYTEAVEQFRDSVEQPRRLPGNGGLRAQ